METRLRRVSDAHRELRDSPDPVAARTKKPAQHTLSVFWLPSHGVDQSIRSAVGPYGWADSSFCRWLSCRSLKSTYPSQPQVLYRRYRDPWTLRQGDRVGIYL